MNTNERWLAPFQNGDFSFWGAWLVARAGGRSLLVSKQGTTITLSDELADGLQKADCPGLLALKLVQRGFGALGTHQPSYFCTKPTPRYFIIDLTGQCNYSCVYCFRDEDRAACKITSERLRDIVDYILHYCTANGVDRIGIQAWGGEPLLAIERVLEMADHFNRSPVRAAIEVETNAGIVTPEMARALRHAGIRIGVSLDGPSWAQIMQRVAKGTEDSYELTMRGLEALRRVYGKELGIISVVTKHTVGSAEELVRFFRDELGLLYVKFNLVRDNPFAREKNLVPDLEQVRRFYGELMDCVVEGWQRGAPLYEGTILTRLENMLYASRKNCCESCGCTGGRSILSFDQQGQIFPCEMTDYAEEKLGSIYDGLTLSELMQAKESSVFHRERKAEQCDGCPWWSYCRGGCTSRVHYAGQSGIDEVACAINRVLYPRIAELMVSQPELVMKMAPRP